jgi:hypothetical protein
MVPPKHGARVAKERPAKSNMAWAGFFRIVITVVRFVGGELSSSSTTPGVASGH